MKGVKENTKPSRPVRERSDTVSEPYSGYQMTTEALVELYGTSTMVIQWSFTIALQPWRQFNKKRYDYYTAIEQRDILNVGIARSLFELDLEPHYTYECTENLNVHVHGHFFSNGINAILFQRRCVDEFGYKNTDPQRLCCLKPSFMNHTSESYSSWNEYMLKHTPEGKYGGLTKEQLNTNLFL